MLRNGIILAVVLVTGLLIAGGVLVAMGHSDQLAMAGSSALVSLLAALLALEPIRRASHISAQRVAPASMIGFAIRLAVSLAGVGLLVYFADMPFKATAIWTSLWYALLLVTEAQLLAGYFTLLNQQVVAGSASSAKGPSC
jgi:hypothetical protein